PIVRLLNNLSIRELLTADRRGDAVEFFLEGVGVPPEMVTGMRQSPEWPKLEALAPTIVYDNAVVGGMLPTERAANVRVHTLVMCGNASYSIMYDVARALSEAIPQAQLRAFEDQGHDVSPEVLVPVLVEFFV
ncbi:MAG: alpha/beta fold hydrolase, partial [Terriglobia bacterium]